jgi:hypothetical protein
VHSASVEQLAAHLPPEPHMYGSHGELPALQTPDAQVPATVWFDVPAGHDSAEQTVDAA